MMWARCGFPLNKNLNSFSKYPWCGGKYLPKQAPHTKPISAESLKLGVGEKPKGRLPRPSYHPQYLAHQKHFFSRGISFGSHLGCVCLHCQENAPPPAGRTRIPVRFLASTEDVGEGGVPDMACTGYACARSRLHEQV